jgi:hypothetical protein
MAILINNWGLNSNMAKMKYTLPCKTTLKMWYRGGVLKGRL